MMSSQKRLNCGSDSSLMLSSMIQRKMEPLMGVLSKFIVEKAFQKHCSDHDLDDKGQIDMLIDEIINESQLLLGPKRTRELEEELKDIMNDHYQEE